MKLSTVSNIEFTRKQKVCKANKATNNTEVKKHDKGKLLMVGLVASGAVLATILIKNKQQIKLPINISNINKKDFSKSAVFKKIAKGTTLVATAAGTVKALIADKIKHAGNPKATDKIEKADEVKSSEQAIEENNDLGTDTDPEQVIEENNDLGTDTDPEQVIEENNDLGIGIDSLEEIKGETEGPEEYLKGIEEECEYVESKLGIKPIEGNQDSAPEEDDGNHGLGELEAGLENCFAGNTTETAGSESIKKPRATDEEIERNMATNREYLNKIILGKDYKNKYGVLGVDKEIYNEFIKINPEFVQAMDEKFIAIILAPGESLSLSYDTKRNRGAYKRDGKLSTKLIKATDKVTSPVSSEARQRQETDKIYQIIGNSIETPLQNDRRIERLQQLEHEFNKKDLQEIFKSGEDQQKQKLLSWLIEFQDNKTSEEELESLKQWAKAFSQQ